MYSFEIKEKYQTILFDTVQIISDILQDTKYKIS